MANGSNTDKITFDGAPQSLVDDGADITHVSYWDAATGGNFFGRDALANDPDAVSALGEVFSIAAGGAVITVTAGDLNDAMAQRVLDSGLGTIYVGLFSGDPGDDGTANEETGIAGFARKPVAAWSYNGRMAENDGIINFDGAPASLNATDMTHYGYFSAAAGGTFLGSNAFSNDPDAVSALGEVFRVADGAFEIPFSAGGDFNDAFCRRLLGSGLGTLYVGLHSGDPGANGTSDEETDIAGFARKPVATWTVAAA